MEHGNQAGIEAGHCILGVGLDTSEQTRFVMIALVFAVVCVIGYANLRLLVRLALRKPISKGAWVLWPALAALVVFCVVDATKIEPNWVQVTHHELETSQLPPGKRFRIAHITDIHLEQTGVREVQMLNLVARERPDVIVLTGDYSVVKTPRVWSQLTDIARRLSRTAPCYAVEGNWDMDSDMEALQKGGVELLYNWKIVRNRRGAEIALGGWSWQDQSVRPPTKECGGRYSVLMCHIPDLFDSAAKAGVDLMLVGHTHGGQIRLPVFGALLPERRLVGKYQEGFYQKAGCLLYVNRGIGMEGGQAPKVRFCCRPEIAVFDVIGKER